MVAAVAAVAAVAVVAVVARAGCARGGEAQSRRVLVVLVRPCG